jgi:site-specific DNA-methyltransferase (adenine-specific)
MKITDKIQITNECNMVLMARYPDNYFDLAIVDPPYGIGFGDYERGGQGVKTKERHTKNGKKKWDDSIPTKEYFNELKRVSKNQIIWGGNYFPLEPTQCFIFWYKQNPVANFSDGELAWTSFKKPALCFDYRYYGNLSGKTSAETKMHPTQKPIELYNFCLDKLAKQDDKILDTHLGSGSIAIACHDYGFELTACELDKDYYDASIKRINNHISQQKLF